MKSLHELHFKESSMTLHTRHLSKHVSQPTKSLPIILDLSWKEGGTVHEEVIPY